MQRTRLALLHPVDLDFEAKAEQVFRVEEQVAAQLERVWEAFADAATLEPLVPRRGVGALRRRRRRPGSARSGARAWAECSTRRPCSCGTASGAGRIASTARPRRSRAPSSRSPTSSAADRGTRVRWTLAVDPLEKLGYMADGTPFEQFLANLFRDAMRGLEVYLA